MKKMKKPAKKKTAKKPAAKIKTAKKPAPKKHAAKAPRAKKPASGGTEALTRQELAAILSALTEMKLDIAKNVEDKRNLDLLEPDGGDSIDQATQSLDKEILFELSDNERQILRDIEAALRKINKNTYGLCEHCKKRIEKKRIKALPSARYCITCQSGTERTRRD
ncbi:MAG: hypothetical protein COT18_09530 [Elusimicrobia bacterium CG08_land_8_20_14_0_20_59_10]|nr:MAG: hypothetical protein COT18_09530 [Elusimicrobia bacterium CG08_land_8_20_14_0_20_59_10]